MTITYEKNYNVNSIRAALEPVFKRYPVRNAILFGSYAKGTACETSDIDILVDSGLKGLAFYGLLEDVSTTFDMPVDLIDTSQIKKDSEIETEIEKTGVLIYERQG